MINQIILEGIVVRTWKYQDDLFVRVASYRDSDLPTKTFESYRDTPDYINVRLNGAVHSPINFSVGMRIRVHGYLQSRDYVETLEAFMKRASKSKQDIDLPLTSVQKRIKTDRSLHEVVMQRILVLEHSTRKNATKGQNKVID